MGHNPIPTTSNPWLAEAGLKVQWGALTQQRKAVPEFVSVTQSKTHWGLSLGGDTPLVLSPLICFCVNGLCLSRVPG